jgi:hypothetical protein
MMLPAARELQRREAAAAEARTDRLLTIIGLWIAAAALVATVVLELLRS